MSQTPTSKHQFVFWKRPCLISKFQGNFYNLLLNHDPEKFEDDLHCVMIDMNGRPANMEWVIFEFNYTNCLFLLKLLL